MAESWGKKKPRQTLQKQLPPPSSESSQESVNPEILSGRQRPRATDFSSLRPALLELMNDNLSDHQEMRKNLLKTIEDKPTSAVYLYERAIGKGVDLAKMLVMMVPAGFYNATDPVVTIETDEAKL